MMAVAADEVGGWRRLAVVVVAVSKPRRGLSGRLPSG